MRILFLIDNLRPGGAQKALLAIASALKSDGWEPVVWCLGGTSEIEKSFAERGVPVVGRHARMWRIALQPLALARYMRHEKVDVLQTFLFHSDVAGRVAARVAKGIRRRNPPYVVSSVRASNVRNHWWQFMLARATARWADAFSSVSWRSLQFASDNEGVVLDRARVIPNGIDLAAWKMPPRDEARRMLDVEPDDFVVLAVGRLHKQKGHKYLLQAAAEVLKEKPNALFLIAGYGPLLAKLERRARKLGIAERVRFLGYCKEVDALLAAADLFVLPSLWEGMSNAILEAMAAEKPVVATAVDGNVEQVVEGETGLLVPPADPRALSEAILRVARDPVLAECMGRAGRSRVEEQFSMEKMIESTRRLYSDLIANAGALPASEE